MQGQADSPGSPLGAAKNSPPTFDIPVELLRQIFEYTSPADQHEVVVLTSVCSAWRYVALGITALFTSAGWDTWPVEFLREWCQRAGNAGLEVMLNQDGIHRGFVDDEYSRLLLDTSFRWHELFLEFDPSEGGSTISEVHTFLSRGGYPQLRTLVLSNLDSEGQNEIFVLPDDFAPNLEELMCKDVHIIRAAPWEKLNGVSINADFWASGTQREDIFRTISCADRLILNDCFFSGVGESIISLNGVRELTVTDDSTTGFAEWPLCRLSFPNATNLVLCGMRPFASEFPEQDKLLWNNAFPAVTSLTLELPYPWFDLILPLLSRDAEDVLWFPALTTLTLLAHRSEGKQHHPTVPQYIEEALIEFLATHSQHHYHNISPMQNLFIRGLVISEEFERQLRSLVGNVEILPENFQDSAGNRPH